MALTKVKGKNFRVFVNSAAVVESQSCSVTIQGNLEDATTQDSTSGFSEEQMTSKQWNVQVENVDASLATLRGLITRFTSDAKTTVGWDQTGGAQNRVAQNAAFARSGQAILSDLSIVANNRQTVAITCQYLGSGALS